VNRGLRTTRNRGKVTHGLSERPSAGDFLLGWRLIIQSNAGHALQLSHRALQHHGPAPAHSGRVKACQVQHGLDAWFVELCRDLAPYSPNLSHFCRFQHQIQFFTGQLREVADLGQFCRVGARFAFGRLGHMVGQLGEGLGRCNADPAGYAHPLQYPGTDGMGYSRGHVAPAGDMPTPTAMAQSFSLANMVPQDIQHNGGAWAKIEQDTRHYVRRAQGDVFVITGPVFAQESPRIGNNGVRVPSHLFKLVYDQHDNRAWAHWQENREGERVSRPITYQELVKRTGVEFLPGFAVSQRN